MVANDTPVNYWQISVAQAIAKLNTRLQSELMKGELELKQMMEQKELTVKRLQEEIKAHKLEMRAVGEAIQEAKSVGQPPWEVTGYKTVPYKDSFHTGLMKRTPTGGYFTS